jgi:predicted molibdopterin-dependent oxidoreductase YjgC
VIDYTGHVLGWDPHKRPCTRCGFDVFICKCIELAAARVRIDDTFQLADGRIVIMRGAFIAAVYCSVCGLTAQVCRLCGLTEELLDGRHWIEHSLCSRCRLERAA